ncbi:MAG: thioredoxin family protein [Gimesia chilikensis]|uniref:thioredoxin family protein n=1 Tax=Gimesia chilikensis TaxID=2605989 RepID=UPI00378C5A63
MSYDAHLMSLITSGLIFFTGCSDSMTPSQTPSADLISLPVVSESELTDLLQNADKPVLIEFSVMTGCFRCDEMRPEVKQLREMLHDRVNLVRMDFNANQALAASLGATVCPSYVLFSNGQPLWTENYPVSGRVIASRIQQNLTSHSLQESPGSSFEDGSSSF